MAPGGGVALICCFLVSLTIRKATASSSCQDGMPANLKRGDTYTLPVGLLVQSTTDRESLQTIAAVKLAVDEINSNRTLQLAAGGVKWRMEVSILATDWQRFTALESGLTQINSHNVVAIMGMAASTTVAVVAPVAGVAGVPVIATAVTDRDTRTSVYYPTFMRACPSDVYLPLALKDLVLHYVWQSVALIYSTAFSGYHAVNDVIDKAPYFGVNVVSSVYIEFDGVTFDNSTGQKTNLSAATLASMSEILKSNCKIIILNVHGSELLAILRYAKKLGLLERGYAWIVLQFFASPPLLNAELHELMYGSVVIRPKLDAARASALAQSLNQRAPAACPTPDMSSLSMESVYSYDATHALGRGVSKWLAKVGTPQLENCGQAIHVLPESFSLRPWKNNTQLVEELRNVPVVTGAGGALALGNDYSSTNYDIFNFLNGKLVPVGDWTTQHKLDLSSVDGQEKTIIWTGDTTEVPSTRGFLGQHLRIYVPLSNPFTFLKRNPPQRNEDFSGIAIDLLGIVANATGFNYTLTLWNGSWTDMVQTVGNSSTPYDMAVGSITVTSERSRMCTFSKSIYLSGLRILVRRPDTEQQGGFWSFFLPFHWSVWVVLLVTLVFSGFVLAILDPEGVGTQRDRGIIVDGLFFSFMCFFFVHEADEIKRPWARIYLAVVQFCMLVIVTTYTANMATFLAGQSSSVGITSYSDLFYKPVAVRNGTTNWNYVTKELGLRQVVAVKGPDEALKLLRQGSVVAYVADIPHVRRISARECDVISLGAQVDSQQYAFALKKNSPWQKELDRALGYQINQGKVSTLFNKYVPSRCAAFVQGDSVEPMTLSNLGGLFILLAIASVMTSLAKSYRMLYTRPKKLRKTRAAKWWPAGNNGTPLASHDSWSEPVSMSNGSSAAMIKEPLLMAELTPGEEADSAHHTGSGKQRDYSFSTMAKSRGLSQTGGVQEDTV